MPMLAALSLLLTPALGAEDPQPAPAAVDAAIERGVAHLQSIQAADGSWSHGAQPRTGASALAVYALLHCGVDRDAPAVHRGIASLQASGYRGTYDAACMLLALTAHDADEHREWILELANDLLAWQREEGDWGYPTGADLSNTQYAALGLWAAARAGVPIEPAVWTNLVEGVFRYGSRSGGYSYGGTGPSETMTAAGIGTLAICEAMLVGRAELTVELAAEFTRRRSLGLEWLAERGGDLVDASVGPHAYYRLYGVERVGGLTGVHRIGPLDWYGEGAASLLARQRADGSWHRKRSGAGCTETAFALLFLRRATSHPMTGRRYGSEPKRHYATRERNAAVELRATGNEPLIVWVSGWGKDASATLTWPGETGRGLRVESVQYFIDGKLAYEVAGDPSAPSRSERFAVRHSFPRPGAHRVRAAVQVLAPPDAGLRAGRRRTLVSPPLEVEIEPESSGAPIDAGPGRPNLLAATRPRVTASSVHPAGPTSPPGDRSAASAVDGRRRTAWLADPSDEHPTLTIVLGTVQRADRIELAQATSVPFRSGAFARALEIEVRVNSNEPQRVRMHPDERVKGRIDLPRPTLVRRIEISIPWRTPGRETAAIGLSEVELYRARE